MVAGLLATAFPNFSSGVPLLLPQRRCEWLHHGGGDISRTVEGTGSWEEFLLARSPHQGLAQSHVPSAGVSSLPLLSNAE